MGSQDGGQDGRKPAEGGAEERPQSKPPRTLNLAELKAAADRARSEVPEEGKAPTEQSGAEGAKVSGEAAAGEKVTPVAEKPADEKPGGEADPKVELDPMDPNNPFWKTQLGRSIRQKDAEVEARFAELNATVQLLQADKGKEPPKKPSTPEEELEAELGLGDDAGKTATEGKAGEEKPPAKGDEVTAKAQYQKSYLVNNAREEFRKDPLFGEIQALMFNRSDPNHTYNKAWSGVPDADYRTNFVNARAHLLEQKLAAAAATATPKPGEGNLKKETPTAPLGVGGDVKTTDGKGTRPVELDEAGKKYVAFMKRKGRDPEKTIAKAFAVDLGAGRSAGR